MANWLLSWGSPWQVVRLSISCSWGRGFKNWPGCLVHKYFFLRSLEIGARASQLRTLSTTLGRLCAVLLRKSIMGRHIAMKSIFCDLWLLSCMMYPVRDTVGVTWVHLLVASKCVLIDFNAFCLTLACRFKLQAIDFQHFVLISGLWISITSYSDPWLGHIKLQVCIPEVENKSK
jgi:hypothetical protein